MNQHAENQKTEFSHHFICQISAQNLQTSNYAQKTNNKHYEIYSSKKSTILLAYSPKFDVFLI